MKTIRIFLLVLIIIGLALLATHKIWVPRLVDKILWSEGFSMVSIDSTSPLNVTYIIDGQPVTLRDGFSEVEIVPGSASKTVTSYFGNDATGDLNGDGVSDVGFILTQRSGGSGAFYYAAAALKISDGYRGTNTVLLGDRIAPQTTEIKNQQLIINYADRAKGEPMTTSPSVGVSKYFKVLGNTLLVN